MNIYKVEQDIRDDYDTFDSFVCVAETEDEARKIHPGYLNVKYDDGRWVAKGRDGLIVENDCYNVWISASDIDKLKVTLIGIANDDQENGIILSSFNAG